MDVHDEISSGLMLTIFLSCLCTLKRPPWEPVVSIQGKLDPARNTTIGKSRCVRERPPIWVFGLAAKSEKEQRRGVDRLPHVEARSALQDQGCRGFETTEQACTVLLFWHLRPLPPFENAEELSPSRNTSPSFLFPPTNPTAEKTALLAVTPPLSRLFSTANLTIRGIECDRNPCVVEN